MRKAFKAAIVALAVVAALPAVAEEAKDPARSRGDRALAGFPGCTENDFNAALASPSLHSSAIPSATTAV